jgi:hypothetical protein
MPRYFRPQRFNRQAARRNYESATICRSLNWPRKDTKSHKNLFVTLCGSLWPFNPEPSRTSRRAVCLHTRHDYDKAIIRQRSNRLGGRTCFDSNQRLDQVDRMFSRSSQRGQKSLPNFYMLGLPTTASIYPTRLDLPRRHDEHNEIRRDLVDHRD